MTSDRGAKALAEALDDVLPRMAFLSYGREYTGDPDWDVEEFYLRAATELLLAGGLFIPDVGKHEPKIVANWRLGCRCGWRAGATSEIDRHESYFDHLTP
jgi:hypothetical protein